MANEQKQKLIGPSKEILTMANLPLKGALSDESLEIINDGGILIKGDKIVSVGSFEQLRSQSLSAEVEEIQEPMVFLPGLIDCHTHICWGGSRAADYAMRIAGKSYLEIAKASGGILDSVKKTRAASQFELAQNTKLRCDRLLSEGVTTCEVKSGYGLNVEDELKILRAIKAADKNHKIDLVPTCLAAHMPPKDFAGTPEEYLQIIQNELLPQVVEEKLAGRIDIFVEESAFTIEQARPYLLAAKELGFSITMHVDQFTAGSSLLAVELGAVSADHLEASTEKEIAALANSDVISVALPGASIGLGCDFTPARKLLDAGASLAISTDWNPGSAPMGDLLVQGAILSTYEKLSTAEVFAGITFRAAAALELNDRGTLQTGKLADFIAFPCSDFREILYQQGRLKPAAVWKNGRLA